MLFLISNKANINFVIIREMICLKSIEKWDYVTRGPRELGHLLAGVVTYFQHTLVPLESYAVRMLAGSSQVYSNVFEIGS